MSCAEVAWIRLVYFLFQNDLLSDILYSMPTLVGRTKKVLMLQLPGIKPRSTGLGVYLYTVTGKSWLRAPKSGLWCHRRPKKTGHPCHRRPKKTGHRCHWRPQVWAPETQIFGWVTRDPKNGSPKCWVSGGTGDPILEPLIKTYQWLYRYYPVQLFVCKRNYIWN